MSPSTIYLISVVVSILSVIGMTYYINKNSHHQSDFVNLGLLFLFLFMCFVPFLNAAVVILFFIQVINVAGQTNDNTWLTKIPFSKE